MDTRRNPEVGRLPEVDNRAEVGSLTEVGGSQPAVAGSTEVEGVPGRPSHSRQTVNTTLSY